MFRVHLCLTSLTISLSVWVLFCWRIGRLHSKPASPVKNCLFTVTFKLEGTGFPIALKLHNTNALNDVKLLQCERVCSRETAQVRLLLFLGCRLVTFWWLGSDVVSSAPSCLHSDLEAWGDVDSIVLIVNSAHDSKNQWYVDIQN